LAADEEEQLTSGFVSDPLCALAQGLVTVPFGGCDFRKSQTPFLFCFSAFPPPRLMEGK